MTRLALSVCVLLLFACGARPIEQPDEVGDEDSSGMANEDTLAGTDTLAEEPDLPGCTAAVCSNQCKREYDECANPMQGNCSDAGTCECIRSPDCLPCTEQECGPYEQCGWSPSAEYGLCNFPCWHGFVYFWDPELGCTIALPQDVPILVLSSFFVEIARLAVPRADACGDPEHAESWVLDARSLTITLCSEACTQFESAGELLTGWGFACE